MCLNFPQQTALLWSPNTTCKSKEATQAPGRTASVVIDLQADFTCKVLAAMLHSRGVAAGPAQSCMVGSTAVHCVATLPTRSSAATVRACSCSSTSHTSSCRAGSMSLLGNTTCMHDSVRHMHKVFTVTAVDEYEVTTPNS